jgi:hypothetical protein
VVQKLQRIILSRQISRRFPPEQNGLHAQQFLRSDGHRSGQHVGVPSGLCQEMCPFMCNTLDEVETPKKMYQYKNKYLTYSMLVSSVESISGDRHNWNLDFASPRIRY